MHCISDSTLPLRPIQISTLGNDITQITQHPLIQPLRITRPSQSQHNPFRKQSKGISANILAHLPYTSHEFINYKPIPKESIDSIEHPSKTLDELTLHKTTATLKRTSSNETENEMTLEIKLHSILTYEMERELVTMSKLKPVLYSEIIPKLVRIPLSSFKNTLILDIDETLTHTLVETCYFKKYNNLDVVNLDYFSEQLQQTISFQVVKRPFLDVTLKLLSELYELIAFTASEKCYADSILNAIDPKKYISNRLYRNNCVVRGDHKIKDLRVLNRDLKHVVMIDNSLISFASQLNNGIPVKPFYGQWDDTELLDLCNILKGHHDCDDFQVLLQENFLLEKIKAIFS